MSTVINDLTIFDGHLETASVMSLNLGGVETAQTIHYRSDAELAQRITRDLDGGPDFGRVIVAINRDEGEFDEVLADWGLSDDLEAIDRVIATLSRLRQELTGLRETGASSGGSSCLAVGEYGRCHGRARHSGDHEFPTVVEWELRQKAIAK